MAPSAPIVLPTKAASRQHCPSCHIGTFHISCTGEVDTARTCRELPKPTAAGEPHLTAGADHHSKAHCCMNRPGGGVRCSTCTHSVRTPSACARTAACHTYTKQALLACRPPTSPSQPALQSQPWASCKMSSGLHPGSSTSFSPVGHFAVACVLRVCDCVSTPLFLSLSLSLSLSLCVCACVWGGGGGVRVPHAAHTALPFVLHLLHVRPHPHPSTIAHMLAHEPKQMCYTLSLQSM